MTEMLIGRIAARLLRHANRLAITRSGVVIGENVILHGRPTVSLEPGSRITVGERTVLTSRSAKTALGVSHPCILRTLTPTASISIGQDSGLSGTTICAATEVRIGCRVLIGADVMIFDTDFHPVDALHRRYASLPQPRQEDSVVIEDDVFVGARSLILKGVKIGRRSVVAAGSVVTRSVPDDTVVGGNPARELRKLRFR